MQMQIQIRQLDCPAFWLWPGAKCCSRKRNSHVLWTRNSYDNDNYPRLVTIIPAPSKCSWGHAHTMRDNCELRIRQVGPSMGLILLPTAWTPEPKPIWAWPEQFGKRKPNSRTEKMWKWKWAETHIFGCP